MQTTTKHLFLWYGTHHKDDVQFHADSCQVVVRHLHLRQEPVSHHSTAYNTVYHINNKCVLKSQHAIDIPVMRNWYNFTASILNLIPDPHFFGMVWLLLLLFGTEKQGNLVQP